MHEQEFTQEAELRDRYIRRSGGLQPFDARNADSNMSRLYHADVVGAITNGQERCFGALFDELHHESFLQRRHPACVSGGSELDPQHITALHMTASSSRTSEISFSKANVRLFPSYVSPRSHTLLTDDEGEFLYIAAESLAFDGKEAFV